MTVLPLPRTAQSPFSPLERVALESYDESFLIEDLLTSRMTFLTGEPKAGKSLFVAGMIRALLEGEPYFCGQRILKPLETVVYGMTDDGADAELRSRLDGTDALRRVSIVDLFAASDERWAEVKVALLRERPGLFVLDTMLGALPGGEDIASGVTAQRVIEQLRPISQAGIPVLIVGHTPKGNGEGLTVASSVMGGRALAGGVRGVIALRKDARHGRRVQTSINRARADLNLTVDVSTPSLESEVPRWTVVRTGGAPSSRGSTVDWRDDFARVVLADQPPVKSYSALADLYRDTLPVGKTAARTAASELLEHVDGVWREK